MPTRRLARVRRNPAHVGTYVLGRTEGRAISRDEAAEQVGISRKLAAFHLDKLVEVVVDKIRRGIWFYSCAASVEGQTAVSAKIMCAPGAAR